MGKDHQLADRFRRYLPLLAAALLIAGFIAMVARFWDPYHGLTRFLAPDATADVRRELAWINPLAWLALAFLLWRLLAVREWFAWCAWAGVLCSAGALVSVRISAGDLPAAALIAGGMLLMERGRTRGATGALVAAALVRETALPAVIGLWRGPWNTRAAWLRNLGLAVAAGIPVLLWVAAIRIRVGSGASEAVEFTSPLAGWTGKWFEVLDASGGAGQRWLVVTTLLATIALSTQSVFFVARMRPADAWWRVGFSFVMLALVLGHGVWAGHPGAVTRVLLPMGLAFAVCAVRWRVSPVWLLLGNLGIFAGLAPFRAVPVAADQLVAGRGGGVSYLVRLESGWYGRESHGGHTWSWSSGRGTLAIATHPADVSTVRVRLRVSGFGEPLLAVRDAGGALLWEGRLTREWQRLEFDAPRGADGVIRLEFASEGDPVPESAAPDARVLAFGVVDVEVVD